MTYEKIQINTNFRDLASKTKITVCLLIHIKKYTYAYKTK